MTDKISQMQSPPDPSIANRRFSAHATGTTQAAQHQWRDLVFDGARTRAKVDDDSRWSPPLIDADAATQFAKALYGATGNQPITQRGQWLFGQAMSTRDRLVFSERAARRLGDDRCDDAHGFVDVTIAMGRLRSVMCQVMRAHAEPHKAGHHCRRQRKSGLQ